jgi:hypothetical protein
MTLRKHFKKLVRTRMQKTAESYATARRHVLAQSAPEPPKSNIPWHFPGNVAATTALRVLLTHAGARHPHTGAPFSEALLFAIAGGIGIGVFSFFYEKEKIATFFLAGRHLWHDHLAYLREALARFGIKPVVHETAGAKGAETALRAALAEHGTCAAWVDAAPLPHRAMPGSMGGSFYHVVTVYAIDDQSALIGDLTDDPVSIMLADLASARARIKKDKHRLLSIAPAVMAADLPDLVRAGLRACHAGLGGAGGVKSAAKNFSLEALRTWADRLHGSNDRERWERVFERGPRLWQALLSVHEWIEHQGGGLCRPLFAEALTEAADACSVVGWRSLAERYRELGTAWSALADVALPADVPAFRAARELHARRSELIHSGGSADEIRAVWARLDALRGEVREQFPLSEAECTDLRVGLQKRVRSLYEYEVAARDALGKSIG